MKRAPLTAPQHVDRRRLPYLLFAEQPVEVVDTRDGLAGEPENDVSLLEPGAFGRAARFDRRHQHARRHGQMIRPRDRAGYRDVLTRDPDVAAPDAPVANQARCDKARGVDPDGEAEPLRREDHRGVNPDDLAPRRHERAARVAGVQGGIGLNDVVDEPTRLRAQRPSERADDPRRHGMLEPVRVPDRDGALPDADAARIAEPRP